MILHEPRKPPEPRRPPEVLEEERGRTVALVHGRPAATVEMPRATMMIEERERASAGDEPVHQVGGRSVHPVIGHEHLNRAPVRVRLPNQRAHPGVDGPVLDRLDRGMSLGPPGDEHRAPDPVEVGVGQQMKLRHAERATQVSCI